MFPELSKTTQLQEVETPFNGKEKHEGVAEKVLTSFAKK